MALFPCNISSGEFKRTKLWENDAPTADYAGSGTAFTINSMSGYDYIEIEFKTLKGDTDTNTILIPYNDFADGVVYYISGLFSSTNNSATARQVKYSSDTALSISSARVYASTTDSPSGAIPITIYGVKA